MENLYEHVPPTKLRNKDEKFTPPKTDAFWLWVADYVFFHMIENRFFALRYKNADKVHNRDKDIPTIMFAPHTNWWDGLVGYNICRRIFKKEIRIMVEELNRFPLLRRCGAFSVNKKSAQSSMPALKFASETIGDLNNFSYIFPQGIIVPPNYRPIEFQTGITYIAQNAVKNFGKVNLVPIAVNYMFLRANKPEVLVDFQEPIVLEDAKVDRKEYTQYLADILSKACDNQFKEISEGKLQEYETLYQEPLQWYRKIEQRLKHIEIKGSGV